MLEKVQRQLFRHSVGNNIFFGGNSKSDLMRALQVATDFGAIVTDLTKATEGA